MASENSKSINCEHLYPTQVWWVDLDLDTDKLTKECYEIKNKHPKGRVNSTRNGYQSNDLVCELPDLVTEIKKVTSEIFKNNYAKSDDTREVFIDNYWLNINPNKAYHIRHTHPGAFLSGVYYVQCVNDEDQGSIQFYQSEYVDFILFSHKVKVPYGCPFKPVKGRLLVFPSYVPHSVNPNLLGNDRIAISFNVSLS
jgi:uncharacterized protein (TIGR02466 family)